MTRLSLAAYAVYVAFIPTLQASAATRIDAYLHDALSEQVGRNSVARIDPPKKGQQT